MQKKRFLPQTRLVMRREHAIKLATGKRVLHIGMGGYIDDNQITDNYIKAGLKQSLHGRLAEVAESLTGLDINPKTIEAMRKEVPGEYFLGDITNPDLPQELRERYDLILFLDVIEHLDNFKTALENLKRLLRPDGKVVITTANAYCFESILKMPFRYEACHEEHTVYFSYLTMKRLLEMNGFDIQEFMFTLEERNQYSSPADWICSNTMRAISQFLPQFGQGIWVTTTPKFAEEGGKPCDTSQLQPVCT